MRRMMIQPSIRLVAVLAIVATLFTACSKNSTGPVAPARGLSLSVNVPVRNEVQASLLGSSSVELRYCVTGSGMTPVVGTAGPFNATGSSTILAFYLDLPSGPARLIALELADASTHQPLAIGAGLLDISASTGSISIDLGSVSRSCYTVNSLAYGTGSYFSFASDTLVLAPVSAPTSMITDIQLSPLGSAFQMVPSYSGVAVAYMGNGDLVNFAAAPVTGAFYGGSAAAKAAAGAPVTTLQAGDVYCVELASLSGHAWIQIIDPGKAGSAGPYFRFRVNTTLPYFAYDRTVADVAGLCLSPIATYTSTYTMTPTPTITPTNTSTNTPLMTSTNTGTNTASATPTITLTNSATNSPTLTLTNSSTSTPTLTSTDTASATDSPTNTPTNSSTPTATNTSTSTLTNSATDTSTSTFTNSLTNTATKTPTPSPTLTATPTPAGTTDPFDLTTHIDGAPVTGSTSGQPDSHNVTVGGEVWGNGAPDVVYHFELSSPKALFFSLCGSTYDTVLYLCTDPLNPTTTLVGLADDSNFCGLNSLQTTLATGKLSAGVTYYAVVDGYNGDSGSYSLAVSTLSPMQVLVPTATPVAETEPNNDDSYFTQTTNLGNLPLGGELVGTGKVKYYADAVDTWSFSLPSSGTQVTLSLDSFDDGNGKNRVAMDLYDSNNNLVDSSAGNTPLDQLVENLSAGTYHLAVYSITDGSDGDYRLVIDSAASAGTFTPTGTPTVTPTPPVGGLDITSYITSGMTIVGDTSTSTDGHQGSYLFTSFSDGEYTYTTNFGVGSPDVIYQFTLTNPQALYFNLSANYSYPILYLLTNPNDPSTMIDLNEYNQYCTSNPPYTLTTGQLQPGTYYVVVDSDYGNDPPYNQGPFTLTVAPFNPACHIGPVFTPTVTVTPGIDDYYFSDPGYIGTVPMGSNIAVQGNVKEDLGYVNTWQFTVQTDGQYTISLDCFDDGTGRNLNGFDFYQSLGGSVSYMYSSPDVSEPNQTTDWLSAGVTYVVAVYPDNCGNDGDYRLVVQGIQPGAPTATLTPTDTQTLGNTPTSTVTATPTISPTPVPTNADITALIGTGQAILGDTSQSVDNHSVTDMNNNIWGSNAPDVAYNFTVSTPERLVFNLNTIGSGPAYYPILYLIGPGGTVSDISACYSYLTAQLTTGLLQAGTYTLVVDQIGYYYNYSYFCSGGPFSLTVLQFNPVCSLNPTSTPAPGVTPGVDDTLFTDAGSLGSVSTGSDLAAQGTVKSGVAPSVNTWKFHVSTAGEYAISADCYDDGTGKGPIGLDLYQSNGVGGFTLIDVTSDVSYPNTMSDWLLPGDYYVAAYSNNCGQDLTYHLVVQGTLVPTPTPEPATDITSNINSGATIFGDTTGLDDAHSYHDMEGNDWGRGAPDMTYQFTINQPQQLDIQMLFTNNADSCGSMVGYLRTKQDDPSTTLALASFFDPYGCDARKGQPALTASLGGTHLITPLLKPGTYYLIIDGSTSNDYGTFKLALSTFQPQCAYIGSSAPVRASQPNVSGSANPNPALADDLGTVSSGTTAVGLGSVQYYVGPQHLWHFTAGTDGAVYSLSLDCFDDGNGLDNVGFDLYASDGAGGVSQIDSSYDAAYPNALSDVLSAGDYYVAVFSNNQGSDGEYRLVVQGGNLPTPTFTPTVTPTPVTPLAVWTAQDLSLYYGLQNVGGLAVYYNALSGQTSVYMSYNFQASTDFDSNVQHWTSSDGINFTAASTITVSGGCPQGLSTDSAGNLYIADPCMNYVEEYNPSNGFVRYIGTYNSYGTAFPGYLYAPTGVAVDSNGNVIAGENQSNYSVQVFNSGAVNLYAWAGGGYDPAVAVNGAGTTVYVTPSGMFSPSGASLGTWGTGAGSYNPGGLCVAPPGTPFAGNLYVSDMQNNQMMEFNSAGDFIGSWGSYGSVPGEFITPSGVALDSQGNIYVADWGDGRVQKFAPR